MSPQAERHRRYAAQFTALVRGTHDWSSRSPVASWAAGDVVDHLLTWCPGFLRGGTDIELSLAEVGQDRVRAWQQHASAIQALLDDPDTASAAFSHPLAGEHELAVAIDTFYTTDVFLHSWDLARATGQSHALEEVECVGLLAGMEPMEDLIRGSGQYGPRVAVPETASAQDRLLGFIGRDPEWCPGGPAGGQVAAASS